MKGSEEMLNELKMEQQGVAAKHSGWLDKLQSAIARLGEAEEVLAIMLGPEVQEKVETKSPDCLATGLEVAIRDMNAGTEHVLRRLYELQQRF